MLMPAADLDALKFHLQTWLIYVATATFAFRSCMKGKRAEVYPGEKLLCECHLC